MCCVRPAKLSRSRGQIRKSGSTVWFSAKPPSGIKRKSTFAGFKLGIGSQSGTLQASKRPSINGFCPRAVTLPLGNVHNITVKPLVDKMKKSLSARTVNKYVEYIAQVVASLKDGRPGDPIHPRKGDSSVMALPVVNPKRQRRPALRVEAINALGSESQGDEQALYVLLAATGMWISEALGLETKHFVNDGRTIQVCQQVDRDGPRVVQYLKTDAGYREVDLSEQVAEYLRSFVNGKEGLMFKTRNGTPYLHNNLEQRWLTPRLQAIGSDEKGMGFHAFRRFRKTWLRGERCQE